MTYGFAWANGPLKIWVALSEEGGAHAEAASALRAEVEKGQSRPIEWVIAPWREFRAGVPEPGWVVAVGSAAQRGMQEMFAADPTPPPLLTVLVPRLGFERIAEQRRLRAGTLSAVYLDQPPARQLALIRLALPQAKVVATVYAAESRALIAALEGAAQAQGMKLQHAEVGAAGVFPALQSVLSDAQALLAVPDPAVFNGQNVPAILTAAYRQQIPLIGFSPAYTKAGALLSLYSTPAQSGAQAGVLLRLSLSAKSLPPPQWPQDFAISINASVARSMGLALDEAALAAQLKQRSHP
jgi:hypothetical protein